MPIKIFSDIDLKGSQIKTARLDNLTDENLLTFNGQIGFDTDDYKLKYYDSASVATIASEEWVNEQQFGVNLTDGNGTTFIDYGTAGRVDFGGQLVQDTTLSGINFDLTIQVDKVIIDSDVDIITSANNTFTFSTEPFAGYLFFQANSAGLGTYIGEATASYGIASLANRAFISSIKDIAFTYGAPPHTAHLLIKSSGDGEVVVGSNLLTTGYQFQVDGGIYANSGTSGNVLRFDESQFKYENTNYSSSFKIDQLGLLTLSSSSAATGTNTIIKTNNLSSGPIIQFVGAFDTTTLGIPHVPLDVSQASGAFYDATIRSRTGRTDYFRGIETHVNGAAVTPGTPVHRIGQHPLYGTGGGYDVGIYELDGTSYHPVLMSTVVTRHVSIGRAQGNAKLHVKGNGVLLGDVFRLDNNNNEIKVLVGNNGDFYVNAGTSGQSTMFLSSTGTTFNNPVQYATDLSPLFTNNTLVTKQYVDNVAGGTLIVDNGLSYGTSGNVGLGGTLYRTTTIDGDTSHSFNIIDTRSINLEPRMLYLDNVGTGTNNALINHSAPIDTITGSNNVIFTTKNSNGAFPIRTGSNNTGVGHNILSSTGVAAGFISSARNTVIGVNAILGDNNGLVSTDNIAIGYNVLTGVGGLSQSIFIGNEAGSGNSHTGIDHVAIGHDVQVARNNSRNVAIGADVRAYNILGELTDGASNATNSVIIGYGSQNKNSNSVVVGGTAAVNSGAQAVATISVGYTANNGTAGIGSNSIAIGVGTQSIGNSSIVMGVGATASTLAIDGIAIGSSALAANTNGVSIGNNSGRTSGPVGVSAVSIGINTNSGTSVIGQQSVAIGLNTKSRNTDAITIGTNADTIGISGIAIGSAARGGTGQDGLAIGTNAANTSGAYGNSWISLGLNSNIGTTQIGTDSIAIGNASKSIGTSTIAIGQNAGNTSALSFSNSISIGVGANQGATNIGQNSIAIGVATKASNTENISIGVQAGSTTGTVGTRAISMGYNSNEGTANIGSQSVALGPDTEASGGNSIVIGAGARSLVAAASGIAIGETSVSGNSQNISIGISAGNTSGTVNNNAISIGGGANAGTSDIGTQSIAIGITTVAGAQGTIALGAGAKARSFLSMSIGNDAGNTTGLDDSENISLGAGANNGTYNIGQRSIAIGSTSRSKSNQDISIGYTTGNTTGTSGGASVSIGSGANAGTDNIGGNSVAIGTISKAPGAQSIALGVAALGKGTEALSLGVQAGNTSGTVGIQTISIGYNSNQGSSDVGGGTIAIGAGSKTKANQSIAIGSGAGSTTGTDNNTSISFGYYSNGYTDQIGQNSIAFGSNTISATNSSIAIGNGAKALDVTNGGSNIAIGEGAGNSSGSTFSHAISFGYQSNGGTSLNIGQNSIAIGRSSYASTLSSVSLGHNAGNNTGTAGTIGVVTISIGANANDGSFGIGNRGIAIGNDAHTKGANGISIGEDAGNTTGNDGANAISIGSNANGGSNNIGAGSIAIGQSTKSLGDGSIAIGTNVQITATGSAIAIGASASVPGGGSGVAVGGGAVAAVEATAIGTGANANFNSSTALGFSAAATAGTKATRYTAVGAYAGRNLAANNNLGAESVSVGSFAYSTSTYGIAIGYQANSNSQESIVIGLNATTDNTGSGTIAIGTGTSAVGGGVALGRVATSGDGASLAVGNGAKAAFSGTSIGGQNTGNTSGTVGSNAISIGGLANSGSVNVGVRSIAMGVNNNSAGAYSVAIGGQQVVSSGIGAMTFGYSNTLATNAMDYSFALVWQETLPEYHIVRFAAPTINNTPLTLHQYPLADDNVYHMRFTILAVQTNYGSAAGTDRASFTFEALAYRASGGGATLEGGTTFNITEIKSANATPWTATIDVLGNNVRTIVTGVNGENINWKLMLHVTRVN